MTTALAPEPKTIANERPELIAFRSQDAAIAQMANEYLRFTIAGIDDKAGFKRVHDARIAVKNTRVAVEKKRVELKAEALKYGQTVDAEARRLTMMLAPVEAHLQAEEDAITEAKAKIKRAAEEAKQQETESRWRALTALGWPYNPVIVGGMTDEQFTAELLKANAAKDERDRAEAKAAERRRAEEAALSAERERLAKIKAEQDAEAARQKAESDRLAAARLAIEQREAEERRQAELAKAREEAAESARVETEQRLAREAAERKAAEERAAADGRAKAEAEEQARLKAEAEKPHREKLLAVAEAVLAISVPDGPQSSAVATELRVVAGRIKRIANGPL